MRVSSIGEVIIKSQRFFSYRYDTISALAILDILRRFDAEGMREDFDDRARSHKTPE